MSQPLGGENHGGNDIRRASEWGDSRHPRELIQIGRGNELKHTGKAAPSLDSEPCVDSPHFDGQGRTIRQGRVYEFSGYTTRAGVGRLALAIAMNLSSEYEPGSRFVLRSNEAVFVVDRKAGAIKLQEQALIGRPSGTEIQLGQVSAMTLQLIEAPPISFATAGQIMGKVMEAMKSGILDQRRLLDEMPMGLCIRIAQADEQAGGKEIEAFCTTPGPCEGAELVAMALQVADIAGFDFWAVYFRPRAGAEVRLSRRSEPGLTRLPAGCGAESEEARTKISSEAFAGASVPAFEPARFRGGYKLTEWHPGIRVVFRRPFSKAAPFVFPFALCAIAGPALWIAGLIFGGDQDRSGLLIVTGIGLAIGVPATAVLGALLPRDVEFDWSSRTLSIRTWFRAKAVPFGSIESLVLKADSHESSGGESGSTEITYRARLFALERAEIGESGVRHELTDTELLKRPEQPLRMAVPLLRELAGAMKIDSRIEDYDFRKSMP